MSCGIKRIIKLNEAITTQPISIFDNSNSRYYNIVYVFMVYRWSMLVSMDRIQ